MRKTIYLAVTFLTLIALVILTSCDKSYKTDTGSVDAKGFYCELIDDTIYFGDDHVVYTTVTKEDKNLMTTNKTWKKYDDLYVVTNKSNVSEIYYITSNAVIYITKTNVYVYEGI